MRPGLLASFLAAAAIAGTASAQARFAEPVRLMAGEKFLGHGRLYPSPVFWDVDGDGRLDVVVGDLPGRLTFALRRGEGLDFEPERKLTDAKGKQIDFHNW
ncbi:MAG: hypothetical protein Fur0037_19310 [Planctomycetota bacterium]